MGSFERLGMRVVAQRVSKAHVDIDGETVGAIDAGLMLLVGFRQGDDDRAIAAMVDKIIHLRVFADDAGKMNRSVIDVGGGLLIVSQFTLYGDTRKGRRPSFIDAAPPEIAIPLYENFVAELRKSGLVVATGRFGAMMSVSLVNDGPVTLILEFPTFN